MSTADANEGWLSRAHRSTMSVFPRLAPRLQDAIVSRLGWTSLRPVQDLAGTALLAGMNAVVLAPTAGGKTEATPLLVAVSKTKSIAAIMAAYDAGQRVFGENYVQELSEKAPVLPKDIEWHLIGHLQRNKVNKVVGLAKVVHTVDSVRLLHELQRVASERGVRQGVLIEVNLAAETSKSGCLLDAVPALTQVAHRDCPAIELRGFMTVPPAIGDSAPWFRVLRSLRDATELQFGATFPVLSMGMSGDIETAIACGSTLVRVGTALFGPRA